MRIGKRSWHDEIVPHGWFVILAVPDPFPRRSTVAARTTMKIPPLAIIGVCITGVCSVAAAQTPQAPSFTTPNVRVSHPAEIQAQLKALADQFGAAGLPEEAQVARALQERVRQHYYQRLLTIHQQQPADLSKFQVRLLVRMADVLVTPETDAAMAALLGKGPATESSVNQLQSLVAEPERLQQWVETLQQNPGQLKITATTHFTMPNGRTTQFRYSPELGPNVAVSPTVEESDALGVTLNATANLVRSDLVKLTLSAVHVSQQATSQGPGVTGRKRLQSESELHVGKTLVLRGLRSSRLAAETSRVPVLGDLPGIGKRFTTTKTSTSNIDHLIFITSEVVTPPAEAVVNRLRGPSVIEPAAYFPMANPR